jgi:hypothetical protein
MKQEPAIRSKKNRRKQHAFSETDQKAFWQHSSAASLTDQDNEIATKEKAINLVQSDFDAKASQKWPSKFSRTLFNESA